jgi:dihydroneopterin aldolase
VPTQDRIFLEGLVFYAYHGVHPEEKRLGQRFIVDIVFTRDLRTAGATDDLTQTTSYSDVYRAVRAIVEGGPYDLIETVAEKIAAAVLAADAAVEDVRVTVRKPDVPMKGSILHAVGVEVFRTRADNPGVPATPTR